MKVRYKCNHCKNLFLKEDLVKYGRYYFCKSCVKIVEHYFGEAKDILDIAKPKLLNNNHLKNACYTPNGIKFVNFQIENFNYLLICLCHEELHRIIHKLEGLKTSYNFDNLAHKSPYVNTSLVNGIFLEEEEI